MPDEIQPLPTLSQSPHSVLRPSSFNSDSDAMFGALPSVVDAYNANVPIFNAAVAAVATQASETADALEAAQDAQAAAVAAAAAAVNSAGTSATSSTSLTLSAGSKTLTIQTGKLFALGQWLVIASTAAPQDQMTGVVTVHDNTTGTLSVNVASSEHVTGAGTYAAWTVSVVGRAAQGIGLQRVVSTVSGAHTIVGAAGHRHELSLTGNVTLTFPAASSSISFDLVISQTNVYVFYGVTWPAVNWSLVGGSPPVITRNNVLVRMRAFAGEWWATDVQSVGLGPRTIVGHGWAASITEPGGTQEGDLFIAIAHGPSVSGSDSISGWSTINDQPTISGGHTSKMYYRLRGATSLSGTAIPNANATESSPFFAVFRGYNTVNLANTGGEIVAGSPTHAPQVVSRTINVDGAILVWAADLFATVEPTVTLPDQSFLTSGDTATYFRTRAKAGRIVAGQSISVQDNHASQGTNTWRIALTAT